MALPPHSQPGRPDPGQAFDPWAASSAHADPEGWADPIEERDRDRRRIRACRLAFSFLGFGLVIASLSVVSSQIVLVILPIFFGIHLFPGQFLPEPFKLVEESLVVWCTFVGVCLLWGRWKDSSWQGRSGLLVLMGFVDVVLWSLDHAVVLGLADQEVGHDWFRECLGHALGWSEFSLIASLAADVAAHLGQPRALDFARGVRSLASIGATLWFLFFYLHTDWNPPFWPLRARPFNPRRDPGQILLWLGEMVLFAINLVQVTALTLTAGRVCAITLREINREERSHELLESPSEAAWDEYAKPR